MACSVCSVGRYCHLNGHDGPTGSPGFQRCPAGRASASDAGVRTMQKRQAERCAIGSSVGVASTFPGLTIDSHRELPKCAKAQHRGAARPPARLQAGRQAGRPEGPSKLCNGQRRWRVMPGLDMSDVEIADLVSFLDGVSKGDKPAWPSRRCTLPAPSPLSAAKWLGPDLRLHTLSFEVTKALHTQGQAAETRQAGQPPSNARPCVRSSAVQGRRSTAPGGPVRAGRKTLSAEHGMK